MTTKLLHHGAGTRLIGRHSFAGNHMHGSDEIDRRWNPVKMKKVRSLLRYVKSGQLADQIRDDLQHDVQQQIAEKIDRDAMANVA